MKTITNLNEIKKSTLNCGDVFNYKSLVFIIEFNHGFTEYKYTAFNMDTGKVLSDNYPSDSLTDIKGIINSDNLLATNHNKSQIAQLIKAANKKITNGNKYIVKNGLYKGDEFISSDMENSIYILEQVVNGEIILTSNELWLLQAPSFNFELDECELLEKALSKSFVFQVLHTNLFRLNQDY